MLITVAFLCGILTRLPTHVDKFPDTCPCFPLYPPREFVKYFSLLSLLLSEYCGFIRTKLLHILSNALYSPFFLNFERRSRSGLRISALHRKLQLFYYFLLLFRKACDSVWIITSAIFLFLQRYKTPSAGDRDRNGSSFQADCRNWGKMLLQNAPVCSPQCF